MKRWNSNAFLILITLALLIPKIGLGQNKEKWWQLSGYVSSMQSVMFDSINNTWVTDNLLHNRLNLNLYPTPNFTASVQLRTRLMYGTTVLLSPGYANTINSDIGFGDLSWNIAQGSSYVLNSAIDRIWLQYSYKKFEVKLGRQRINWGQTFVWNPNDLFNVYSYFDFDYPERPGSDALTLKYYPTYSSEIQAAAKVDSAGKITAALFTRFNVSGVDIQVLGGVMQEEDYVLGCGFTGDISGVSVCGETSYFRNIDAFSDTSGKILASLGIDYSFTNELFLQGEVLYCNKPLKVDNGFNSIYTGSVDARNMAWSQWSFFTGLSYPVTPILKATLAAMFYPDLNAWFVGPTVDISVVENLDCSIIYQAFKSNDMPMGVGMSQDFQMNIVFLRLKYNF